MFTRKEILRNLHGCLDVALLMPKPHKRFGNSYEEMVRSFYIPIICFPITLFLIYMAPPPQVSGESAHMISFIFSARIVLSWMLFFGFVYWITKEIGRVEHFYKFVIAANWITIPSTILFLPVIYLIHSGAYSWDELQPLTLTLLGYMYLFTAHMAARVLKAPWEIGGFIVIVSMIVDDSTADILYWVSDKI